MPGKYLLSATAIVFADTAKVVTVSCYFSSPTVSDIDQGLHWSQVTAIDTLSSPGTIAMLGTADVASTETVSLKCFSAVASTGDAFVLGEMTALEVGAIN